MCKSHSKERITKLFVPVTGAASETIESLVETPQGARSGDGTTCRGGNDDDFIKRKVWLAEGVLAVSLFEYALIFNGNRREKME